MPCSALSLLTSMETGRKSRNHQDYPSKSSVRVFLPRSFALLISHPYPTPLFLNKSRPTGTWWSQEGSMLAVSMAFTFQATAMELLCSNGVLILNVPLAFSQYSICLAGSKRRQSCCCGRLYFRHFRSNLVGVMEDQTN